MSKRKWILLGTSVPVLALIALLAWASVKSGGNPGGLGVNNEFGQVSIKKQDARGFSLELLNRTNPGGTELRPTLSLADLRGKLVVLDFWASWCLPCQQEAPDLAQVYLEFQGAPVEFVGVDIWDNRSGALNHIERYKVPYPNGFDGDGVIAIDYGVRGIPEKIFIDRNGETVKKFVGPITADILRETLNQLLASDSSQGQN